MQDANRRRFWQSCLLGLMLLALAGNSHSDDSIINRVEALQAGEPVVVLGAHLHSRDALVQFYEARNYEPAWRSFPAREELLQAIREVSNEGLNPGDYHYDSLADFASQPLDHNGEDLQADLDLVLSDAFLLLATHLHDGKLDQETRSARWQPSDQQRKMHEVLAAAILDHSIDKTLQGLKPEAPAYRKLAAFRKEVSDLLGQPWPVIDPGPAIRPGDTDSRMIEVRERLRLLGDLPARDNDSSEAFDTGFADQLYSDDLLAVIPAFQARHGLDPDGIIGRKTLVAINQMPLERLQQIDANLERWRWLPDSLGDTYILVNIAGYELIMVENGQETMRQRVIVGQPYRQTPVFSDRIRYLVFNPTWTVPRRLMIEDQLPVIRRDPGYLDRLGFKVYQGWGANRVEIDPATIDWDSLTKNNFPYQLVQQPGPQNAVGQVKFMFPNQYDVYLHDTPGQYLFSRMDRTLSSGCIRVERPFELANKLLEGNSDWDHRGIQEALQSSEPINAILRNPVPVHLQYWTVWVDRAGTYQFREDIYGRDRQLLQALRSDWQGNLQLTPRSH